MYIRAYTVHMVCVSCLHSLCIVLFLVTACRRSKIGRSDSTSGVEWNIYILEKHTLLSIAHEFVSLNGAVCTSDVHTYISLRYMHNFICIIYNVDILTYVGLH